MTANHQHPGWAESSDELERRQVVTTEIASLLGSLPLDQLESALTRVRDALCSRLADGREADAG